MDTIYDLPKGDSDMDVCYIQLNDWTKGVSYPDAAPFTTWLDTYNQNVEDKWVYCLDHDLWVKEQGLCILAFPVDVSITFYITALRTWVEEVCPVLLTTPEYTERYLCTPDMDGVVYGQYSDVLAFLPYSVDNIGVMYPSIY